MLRNRAVELVDSCVVCESSVVEKDDSFAQMLALESPYGVAKCRKCGLRWLNPRPTSSAYNELYSDELYFGGVGTPEIYCDVVKGRLHHFTQRIKNIEVILDRKAQIDLLDIGAATGEFVHLAQRMGHKAKGVELSEDARKKALKEYGVVLDAANLDDLAEGTFDAVHMNHVLEHMSNPYETLKLCHKLLKSGGIMVIEVPQQFFNDLDKIRKFLGLSRPTIFNAYSLHHTYFFSPSNLSLLLDRSGFDLLTLKTAVSSRTPIWPVSMKNILLRVFLWVSDRIHQGGNIIEVYVSKK